ncbi:MAG: hypothetical protein E7044_12145 [Lentisphaerae bacterium]|nr:hypothetical protein [Lentisphaerota bacterium]
MVLESGKLLCGCNYWASHAGMYMWRNWSAETVEEDLKKISLSGMTLLRVFPLWEDFQPVEMLRAGAGSPAGYARFPEGTFLKPGEDGLSPVMLERFRIFADLAEKHHLKLVVALLTGWMSGRLFVPRVLEGRNLFTDPEALKWESRFIRGFVSAFKDHPAIVAWEPGNECNCLSNINNSEAASWHWLDFIAASIRNADPEHPVWTGMHGAAASPGAPWSLQAQGELYDALTTHPYPLFTAHCGKSALNTVPAIFHSTAETLYYRGLSGKPAIIEEIGTLGPGIVSEERRSGYIRATVMSALVHNCLAYLWWCAFDQDQFDFAPYGKIAIERELGLFSSDGKAPPALHALSKVMFEIKTHCIDKLPPRKIDALVVTTPGQDAWQAAYGAFVLGKQVGIEVEFASSCGEIPESSFYWLPAVTGSTGIDRGNYRKLIERVENGAVLLVTDSGDGMLQPFESVFGCRVDFMAKTPESYTLRIGEEEFTFSRPVTRRLIAGNAQVPGTIDGTPGLTCHTLGKGKVIYLNGAPELSVLDEKTPHLYKIYREIAALAGLKLAEKHPGIGRTIHRVSDLKEIVIEINYTDCEIDGLAANDFRVI